MYCHCTLQAAGGDKKKGNAVTSGAAAFAKAAPASEDVPAWATEAPEQPEASPVTMKPNALFIGVLAISWRAQ